MLPVTLAVFAELRCEHGQANLRFLDVCARNFHENVASVERDFGRFRVNDWGQGQNLAILIVKDWVFVERLQDRQKLLHFDVIAEDIE